MPNVVVAAIFAVSADRISSWATAFADQLHIVGIFSLEVHPRRGGKCSRLGKLAVAEYLNRPGIIHANAPLGDVQLFKWEEIAS